MGDINGSMDAAQFWHKMGDLVDRSAHLIHYADSSKLKSEDVSDFLVDMDSLASEWYNRSDNGKSESVPRKPADNTRKLVSSGGPMITRHNEGKRAVRMKIKTVIFTGQVRNILPDINKWVKENPEAEIINIETIPYQYVNGINPNTRVWYKLISDGN